jgi:integrase
MESGYFIRTFTHGTGEKSPMLMKRSTGLPDVWANEWKLDRRSVTRTHMTLRQELLVIAFFYDLASLKGWSIDSLFASGKGLSSAMISAVQEQCWFWRSSCGDDSATERLVSDRYRKFRVATIRAYCAWRFEIELERVDGESRGANAKRLNIVYNSNRHEKRLRASAAEGASRRGLSDSQLRRLVEVIHPRSPANPFQKRFRFRNFLIVQILLSYGLRRGELLLLTIGDVDYRSHNPRIAVRRMPDSKVDSRTDVAVKTRERKVAMSDGLRILTRAYIKTDRASMPRATRTPFLFLGAHGGPLGTDGFQNIFDTLRCVDPILQGISGHHLRHTWADAIEKKVEEKVRDGELTATLGSLSVNYLGGWTQQSTMAAQYSQGYIESCANEIHLLASERIETELRNVVKEFFEKRGSDGA